MLVTDSGYEVLTLSAGSPPPPAFRPRRRPFRAAATQRWPHGRRDLGGTRRRFREPLPRRQGRAAWPRSRPVAHPPRPHRGARLAALSTTCLQTCGVMPVWHAADARWWPWRLRARRAVSAFRRRRAGAAARTATSRRRTQLPEAHRSLHRHPAGTSAWIGSSVRTVADCVAEARRDVTMQTAMLESAWSRRRRAVQRLQQSHRRALDPQASSRQDAGDAPAPHQIRGHALRAGAQLQGIARRPARPAGPDLGGARAPGQSWDELAAKAWSRPFEARQIKRNEGPAASLIRARLHVVAGRREDRLVFDLQTAVAESLRLRRRRRPRAPRCAPAKC